MRSVVSNVLIIILVLIFFDASTLADQHGLDYPHNSTNSINCWSCHYNTANPADWATHIPQDIDDTPWNNLCWSCHNDVDAEYVLTHSSLNTSNQYDEWTIECKTCHWVHHQSQMRKHGANSYVTTATTAAVTESTVTRSGGAAWEEDEYAGYIVLPNISQFSYNYIIVSNSSDTLNVEGPIDLTKVNAGDTMAIIYGNLIKDFINTPNSGPKAVKFLNNTGTNSFADGDSTYDGVCEVCHTQPRHFRNDGSAPDQNHDNLGGKAGEDCIDCHAHDGGFGHGGGSGTGCEECHGHDIGYGGATGGKGSYASHSTHTENDSDDLKGPHIDCGACHDTNNFPFFKSGTDGNGDNRYSLSETDVCDTCHSPGGTYDGLNDATVGAKTIWRTGAYVATDDSTLRPGKEKWCATCHDEDPSVISSISAPNIVGDEDGAYPYGTGWGYYKTGHGLKAGAYPASKAPAANQTCSGCHDFSTIHIDGNARTYSAANDNYQAGYRLLYSMDIPRNDSGEPVSDFALCFECHASEPFLVNTNYDTNFRTGPTANEHWRHNQAPTTGQFNQDNWWDSDWNGTGDSKASCPACHNVHGSPSPRMIRHGELISSPGTTDKVPSLNFRYTPEESYPTLEDSTGGSINGEIPGGGTIANTGVCNMCHSNNVQYTRTPNDMAPRINGVFGLTGSNVLAVVFSEGVYTTTGSTGDLVAGDFTFTDTDNNRTINGVTHTAGDDFATLSLSSALDSSNDIDIDTLAAATGTSIYDDGDNPMVVSPVTVTSDGTAPVVSDQSPADSSLNNAPDTDIIFTLTDSGSGIDWTSFSIQLSGSRGYSQTYTNSDTSIVSKSGTRYSYSVTIDPDVDFSHDETITVTVNADDQVGNSMTPAVWSFSTLTGGGPFTRVLHPSGLADNSGGYSTYGGDWADILDSNDGDDSYVYRCCGPGGEMFSVHMDNPTGLDSASIQSVTIHAYVRYRYGSAPDSAPYAANVQVGFKTGTNTLWSETATTDTSGDYNLVSSATYTTDSDGGTLDLADIDNLQASVNRTSPKGLNAAQFRVTEIYAEIIYGVSEGDTTPPIISDLNPANSATDIAVDSNLTFTLADDGGGVDWSTFQIQLSGDQGSSETYTDLDTTEVTKTGTMASYNVTVDPDADFSTGEVLTVTVNVDDQNGNALTPPTWSFTTEAVAMQTLHPSGLGELIDDTQSDVQSVGGDWPDILDTNDGDTTHAYMMSKFNGGGPTAGQHPAGFKVEVEDVSGMSTFSEVRAYFVFRYDTPGGGPPATYDKITLILDTGGASEITQEYQYTGAGGVPSYTTISISSTTDPDGGSWDLADIQNLRAGFKLETRENVGWLTTYAWVTEVYVEVDP